MTRSIVGYLMMLMLILLSIVHAAIFYPKLPLQVVSHFNLQGHPDETMGKGTLVTIYVGTVLVTALIAALTTFLIPRLPLSLVNLPNKDYWFAPSRKKASFTALSAYIVWFINATIALLIVSFHACFEASLGQKISPWYFPVAVGIYLVFTLVWCVRLLWRFRRPKEA